MIGSSSSSSIAIIFVIAIIVIISVIGIMAVIIASIMFTVIFVKPSQERHPDRLCGYGHLLGAPMTRESVYIYIYIYIYR